MKIYSCPAEVPPPEPDYSNYDHAKERAAEDAHLAKLKAFLQNHGYPGQYTGEIYREQIADGYALYMVADGGRTFALIHLPYGDAYQSRNVQFLPKSEIIRRIKAEKQFAAVFDWPHVRQGDTP